MKWPMLKWVNTITKVKLSLMAVCWTCKMADLFFCSVSGYMLLVP